MGRDEGGVSARPEKASTLWLTPPRRLLPRLPSPFTF